MTRKKLIVASQKALDIAHRIAQHENRTVAEIVERALQAYEARSEPAAFFYQRLAARGGADAELEHMINSARKPQADLDL